MKTKISLTIDAATLDRFKNAMYWTPGLTMSGVVEKCMESIADELELTNKQKFLPRGGNMRRGPTIGMGK